MKLEGYAKRKLPSSTSTVKKNISGWKKELLKQFVKKKGNVLDVGCAGGALSETIRDFGMNYYGIDYNSLFVKYCQKKRLRVKQCDLAREKIPFEENSFDLVYCSHVLEHLTTREQILVMKEFSRVLKPGGILLLFAPTPYHWYFWDDETHARPCTHGQLSKLAANFQLATIAAKYTKTRFFPTAWQRFLRLPPLRWFLWEVFLVAKKNHKKILKGPRR